MRVTILSLIIALMPVAGLAGESVAVHPSRTDIVSTARGVSLDEAVRMVRSRYDGKVIKAESRRRDGRVVHYIKLLTDRGRVRTIRVDAETGRILD